MPLGLGVDDLIARKYQAMSQAKPAPVRVGGDPAGEPAKFFGKTGVFGDVAAGGSGTYGSFTGRNSSPGLPAVVTGNGSPFGMIDTYRTQGFTPEQAVAAVVGGANAERDLVEARLRPTESAASVALTGAQTQLEGERGKYFGQTARAENARVGADTGRIGAETGSIQETTRGARQVNKLYKTANSLIGDGSPEGAELRSKIIGGLFGTDDGTTRRSSFRFGLLDR